MQTDARFECCGLRQVHIARGWGETHRCEACESPVRRHKQAHTAAVGRRAGRAPRLTAFIESSASLTSAPAAPLPAGRSSAAPAPLRPAPPCPALSTTRRRPPGALLTMLPTACAQPARTSWRCTALLSPPPLLRVLCFGPLGLPACSLHLDQHGAFCRTGGPCGHALEIHITNCCISTAVIWTAPVPPRRAPPLWFGCARRPQLPSLCPPSAQTQLRAPIPYPAPSGCRRPVHRVSAPGAGAQFLVPRISVCRHLQDARSQHAADRDARRLCRLHRRRVAMTVMSCVGCGRCGRALVAAVLSAS